MIKKNAMVNNILAFLASSRFAEMKSFKCIQVENIILNEYNCNLTLEPYAYIVLNTDIGRGVRS